jgi:hypothetical protein
MQDYIAPPHSHSTKYCFLIIPFFRFDVTIAVESGFLSEIY